MTLAVLLVAALAFTLSASAGLGGSLILVPALSLLLGTKEGVALSALLLACNNVGKLVVYRRTVPFRASAAVVALTVAGAALGARLLVAMPEPFVGAAVVAAVGLGLAAGVDWGARSFPPARDRTLLGEGRRRAAPPPNPVRGFDRARLAGSALSAFVAGASSGFSGTSGPLKGVAIRSLGFDRMHFVGAASLVSFAGDALKSAIYTDAALLDRSSWAFVLAALPLMAVATVAGRRVNEVMGERAFLGLFWVVMAGYVTRLVARL